MNRDEIKADAEALAKNIEGAFLDDWIENACWVALGIVIGYIFRWATG